MISRLAMRVTLVLTLILGAGMAMTSVLSLHIFKNILADVLTSRFEFILNDLRRRFETQMSLGLDLSELQGITKKLEEYLQTDKQILSIEVFDETGIVLFGTDPGFVGDFVTEKWLIKWNAGRAQSWDDLERNARVVGVPLQDSLGRDVGSLALRYSRDFFDNSIAAQASPLLIIGTIVVLCMTPFSIIGAMILLHRLRDDVRVLNNSMEDVANWDQYGSALVQEQVEHPEFTAFAATALAAHDAIDTAMAEIRRLDEEEVYD